MNEIIVNALYKNLNDGYPPHYRVFEEIPWVDARFFTAEGGHSTTDDYMTDSGVAGLNCALASVEEPTTIQDNRMLVARTFGLETTDQILTTREALSSVLTVSEPWNDSDRPDDNAVVTANVQNYVLGILAADCAAVLFADTRRRVIGSAHIGAKQAFDGLLEKTILELEKLGSHRPDLHVAIGPCVGVEAGHRVKEDFMTKAAESDPAVTNYFSDVGKETCGTKFASFWFQHYLSDRLRTAGVGLVTRIKLDTYTSPSCYSKRRGSAPSSLMFSGLLLKNGKE